MKPAQYQINASYAATGDKRKGAGRVKGMPFAEPLQDALDAYSHGRLGLTELWSRLQAAELSGAYERLHDKPLTIQNLGELLQLSREQRRELSVFSRHLHELEECEQLRAPTVHTRGCGQAVERGPVTASRPSPPADTACAAAHGRKPERDTQGKPMAAQVQAFLESLSHELGVALSGGLPSWVVQGKAPKGAGGFLLFTRTSHHTLTSPEVTGPPWHVRLYLQSGPECPTHSGEFEELRQRVAQDLGDDAAAAMAGLVEKSVLAMLRVCRQHPAALFLQICSELRQGLADGVSIGQLEASSFPQSLLRKQTLAAIAEAEALRAQALLGLEDYPSAFPTARARQRRIHFRVGPTNSGKTHDAIEALKAAQSGLYLAPLRLLALEIRDRLVAAGVPCNLVTGEERELIMGARHTACTVEMLPSEHDVEVAVLDEIQMLQDAGRGWAWTAALVGAPGKDVYVCGDASVLALCSRLVSSLGEPQDTLQLERKTALTVEPTALGDLSRVKLGDAVVAFSRREVLSISSQLREKGFKVATLYSALAPEVRRAEARRFSTGEAEVVVATDVISMGLNLPIRRVVFSASQKFDGTKVRTLSATEARQIAGRAGRFGIYPEGFVSAIEDTDLRAVRAALKAPLGTTISRLPLGPSRWHISQLADVLGTSDIGMLLEFFATKIAVKNPLFQTAKMEDFIALGRWVDHTAPGMSLDDKYDFSCAPVSSDRVDEIEYFLSAVRAHSQGLTVGLPQTPSWVTSSRPDFLEEAEGLSKKLGLYSWLSFKFPETFTGQNGIAGARSALCRYIENALLTQGGEGRAKAKAKPKPKPKDGGRDGSGKMPPKPKAKTKNLKFKP